VGQISVAGAASSLTRVSVSFEVSGEIYTLPDDQATMLGEKLRLFAAEAYPADVELLARLGADEAWVTGARAVADFIEESLVGNLHRPLPLEGKAADAVYQVLRIAKEPAGSRAFITSARPTFPLTKTTPE
jgi:hypothetical protein